MPSGQYQQIPYPIIIVPDNAALLTEQLGTKEKFWFKQDNKDCLFKRSRPNTGEDWAEKVACELCSLLNIPHAEYNLATWQGESGVVATSFVPSGGRLVHGNELLAGMDKSYPRQSFFQVKEHILKNVLTLIRTYKPGFPIGWDPLTGINLAAEVFVGYLMLDAWIANQDRHHENWSLVVLPSYSGSGVKYNVHLSPSYDHASSLGRNESDESRADRLGTKDKGRHISHYITKATSAFYAAPPNSSKPLSTLDAFMEASRQYREAARLWLEKLESISFEATRAILEKVPKDRISPIAIEFAQQMLILNRERLLTIKDSLQ